ncbi:NAD-dependent epimerase/dehydratase family protein [Niallia sp. 03133]|uniref:NAD-dependent epimerase/dehydratase family protein n=1 Tax=Niallia sp. 03133 TaxID=3458060 RepID=UPI0040441CFD
MKVLVTGGASCIGVEVVKDLVESHIKVVSVDDRKPEVSFSSDTVSYYQIKIERQALKRIIIEEQVDYVIHLKAIPFPSNSIKDSYQSSEKNISLTIEVLEACAAANIKKIIFPSTVAVYGESNERKAETAFLQPSLFLGVSKKIEEQYIQNYQRFYGLSYTILRFSTIYGCLDNKESKLISSAIDQYIKEKSFFFPEEEQQADFIYIKDALAAFRASITAGDNEIINIASGSTSSFHVIEEIIYNGCEGEELTVHTFKKEPVKGNSQFATEKANYLLHWKPERTLEEGIKEMIMQVNRMLIGNKKHS